MLKNGKNIQLSGISSKTCSRSSQDLAIRHTAQNNPSENMVLWGFVLGVGGSSIFRSKQLKFSMQNAPLPRVIKATLMTLGLPEKDCCSHTCVSGGLAVSAYSLQPSIQVLALIWKSEYLSLGKQVCQKLHIVKLFWHLAFAFDKMEVLIPSFCCHNLGSLHTPEKRNHLCIIGCRTYSVSKKKKN